MSNSYGKDLRLTIFGQSHSPLIGMTLEGIPADESIDLEALQRFLDRRAAGENVWSTARREADIPQFTAGLKDGRTCGDPITAVIPNEDVKSGDYDALRTIPRPGHADFTAYAKYGDAEMMSGGGHFSGRMTAALCIAGGICLQLLEKEGITVISRISKIGGIADAGDLCASTAKKNFPTVSDASGKKMQEKIAAVRAMGDSVGGEIEIAVLGLPVGLGEHIFDGMENRISAIVFGIPAVKGIAFGEGFGVCDLLGSENNDAFAVHNGKIVTKTNHCGGILGGITDGMPLTFRVAVKPTPSIAKKQQSVNLKTMEETTVSVGGRHDACIVPRAVPCVEAAAAIAVYDALLARRKEQG